MASEVKANKISPATGTDVTLGDTSDTFTVPSGSAINVASGGNINVASSGEIDIASGATLDVNGTIDLTGATKTGFPAGGLTQAQQWRVTTDFSISTSPLYVYQNWEKPEAADFPGSIGTDMVVDATTSATLSGAWTFPVSGTWLVRWSFYNEGVGGSASCQSRMWATDDNGASWEEVVKNDSYGFHNQDCSVTMEYIINIDDESTDKIRFACTAASYGIVIRGDTNANAHYATFMRLGDKA